MDSLIRFGFNGRVRGQVVRLDKSWLPIVTHHQRYGERDVPPTVRPSTPTPEDEDAIPMLTDVVNVQRYHPDQLPRNFEDVDWSNLAGQVRENVLERLLRRGDILLDGQMNHALAPVISRAVETMTRDVHDTLNRLIRDIVARAVNEEITRLHAEMARQNHDD